ncbi:MAG: hypothetical protein ACYTFY_04805 [Planctomycetota bacterium]|jgi:hypothetical protein
MKISKLILLTLVLSIGAPSSLSADIYSDAEPWHELHHKIRNKTGSSLLFWKDMEYKIKGEIPKSLRKSYPRDFIFIISPMDDWQPTFFTIDRKLFKKRVGKPRIGQRMLVKGKVKRHSTSSRHKKIYVIDVADIRPYFDFDTVEEGKVKETEYKNTSMADVKMDFEERIDDKVLIDTKFGQLTKMFDKIDKVMGIDSGDWALIFVNEEAEERIPFIINKEEQKKSYELSKHLKWNTPVKIYGRITRRFDWHGDRAGIIVDKVSASQKRKDESGGDAPKSGEKQDHRNKYQADGKGGEEGVEREAGDGDSEEVSPLDIKKEGLRFKNKSVKFTHVYRGFVQLPQRVVEKVGPIKDREWMVLRNKQTDLEGVIAIFEHERNDIKKVLEGLESGDNLEIEGVIRIHEEGFRKKIFLIVESVNAD